MSTEFSDSQPNLTSGATVDPLSEELHYVSLAEVLAHEAVKLEDMSRDLRSGIARKRTSEALMVHWSAGFATPVGFPEVVHTHWQASEFHKQAKVHAREAMLCEVVGEAYIVLNALKPKPRN